MYEEDLRELKSEVNKTALLSIAIVFALMTCLSFVLILASRQDTDRQTKEIIKQCNQ